MNDFFSTIAPGTILDYTQPGSVTPSTYSPLNSSIDYTQPSNSNATSGSAFLGNLGSWLTVAAQGAGSILGALNKNTTPATTTTTTTSNSSIWILAGAGALLVLFVVLIGFGGKK
jgi:hypothetical protein